MGKKGHVFVFLSPGEDEAEQGADENEHLVEHGRVCSLNRSVQVILKTT